VGADPTTNLPQNLLVYEVPHGVERLDISQKHKSV
jgi:hypothetical protein